MQNVRREVTNNLKTGKDFTEYEKYTYECKTDDVWVTTETPLSKKQPAKPSK
jgi:hypothetical protein